MIFYLFFENVIHLARYFVHVHVSLPPLSSVLLYCLPTSCPLFKIIINNPESIGLPIGTWVWGHRQPINSHIPWQLTIGNSSLVGWGSSGGRTSTSVRVWPWSSLSMVKLSRLDFMQGDHSCWPCRIPKLAFTTIFPIFRLLC